MRIAMFVSFALLCGSASAVDLPRTDAPKDAKVYFIAPLDGEVVAKEFTVRFGLSGMGVAPAGTVKEATGHHHLLIDTELPDMGLPVPNDAKHMHFGNGQTEVTITLEPGEHTLQLLLADYIHIPHREPVMSEKITVLVE